MATLVVIWRLLRMSGLSVQNIGAGCLFGFVRICQLVISDEVFTALSRKRWKSVYRNFNPLDLADTVTVRFTCVAVNLLK